MGSSSRRICLYVAWIFPCIELFFSLCVSIQTKIASESYRTCASFCVFDISVWQSLCLWVTVLAFAFAFWNCSIFLGFHFKSRGIGHFKSLYLQLNHWTKFKHMAYRHWTLHQQWIENLETSKSVPALSIIPDPSRTKINRNPILYEKRIRVHSSCLHKENSFSLEMGVCSSSIIMSGKEGLNFTVQHIHFKIIALA